jgi:hypothetical protein
MHIIPDITVGNLLTLIVMVIGFVVTWTRQDMRIKWLESWVGKHQEWADKEHNALEALKLEFARHNAKVK